MHALRSGMTISQVLQRTWKHRHDLEFSFLTLTPHLKKFPLAFKSWTHWDSDEKAWQTWTYNFERRFRYRHVVDLKLPNVVISRCCFAENGTELFLSSWHTCCTLIFSLSTNQNLSLRRCRCQAVVDAKALQQTKWWKMKPQAHNRDLCQSIFLSEATAFSFGKFSPKKR